MSSAIVCSEPAATPASEPTVVTATSPATAAFPSITYSAPVATYVAQPTVFTAAPTYATPITYAAPSITYGAPVYVSAPATSYTVTASPETAVTYAAPALVESVDATNNILGSTVISSPVTYSAPSYTLQYSASPVVAEPTLTTTQGTPSVTYAAPPSTITYAAPIVSAGTPVVYSLPTLVDNSLAPYTAIPSASSMVVPAAATMNSPVGVLQTAPSTSVAPTTSAVNAAPSAEVTSVPYAICERVDSEANSGGLEAIAAPAVELDVRVPDNYVSGQKAPVQGPNGEALEIMLPAGAQPGKTMTIRMKPPAELIVTVPEGVAAGHTMFFETTDVPPTKIALQVPEGKNPGDTFEATPPAVMICVPAGAKAGDAVIFSFQGQRCRTQVPEVTQLGHFAARLPRPDVPEDGSAAKSKSKKSSKKVKAGKKEKGCC